MTNLAILEQECRNRGITEDKVKKGEHALFETRLWKHSSRTKHNDETNEDEEKESMYMTKAFLFGESQVEKVEQDM